MRRPLASGIALLTVPCIALAAGCGSVGGLTGFPPGGVSENAPPAVVTVVPPAESTAPADAPVSLTFNKAMSPGGFEISAEPSVTFTPAQWSEDVRTVTVRPNPALTPGTRYTIRVRARDRQGNVLGQEYVWRFMATAPSGVSGEGRLRLAERIDVGLDAGVFTLFAALLVAAPGGPSGEPGSVRATMRARMSDLPVRVVDPVRRFLADHPASIEQYLAATLSLAGPPEFREAPDARAPQGPYAPQGPSPAPARDLSGLGRLLAQFHASAGIGDLWKAHERAYAGALDGYRREAPMVLGRAAEYLRAAVIPAGRITVLPNLVDAPGQGYLIRQGDRALFIVGSGAGVDRLGLLRPFVRLLVEPVRGQAIDHLQRTEPLYAQVREVAARHGYRSWQEIVVESLIEATAIRLAGAGDEGTAAQRAAYARGLALVDHFTAQLADHERTTISLVDYYPRMLAAVDLDAELRRWADRKPN